MNDFMYLSSQDNPKLKLYRKLASSASARRKEGLFVAEGVRLVTDAAAESADIRCVFLTEDALGRYGDAVKLLEEHIDRRGFFILSEAAAKSISGTENSQGIFAVCGIPDTCGFDALSAGKKYIILDNIQDPGNMGTMLRTADACGIDGVILCGGCDPFSPKAVRSAMGSVMRVRLISGGFEEAACAVKNEGIPLFASVVDTDAEDIKNTDFSQGGAVIIGNEGSGIPACHKELADRKITIKMKGTVNSLNAAMAAGIIMWELTR